MKIIKAGIRKTFDVLGISVYPNSSLPVGTDYRKTIRYNFKDINIKTIFDVGANEGQFCLHANELFPESKIYSFEPISSTYQILKTNTSGISNIILNKIALGDSEKEETIFIQEKSVINSLNPSVNIKSHENQLSEIIKIKTLDNFCEENKISSIDILKIDTEGFDLNVLKGSMKMIQSKKVKFIFIEVTFDEDNKHNSSFNTISSYLAPFGFKLVGFFNQSIFINSHKMDYCDALFLLQPNQ